MGGGTRFVDPAEFPAGRLRLLSVEAVGDMAVLTLRSPVMTDWRATGTGCGRRSSTRGTACPATPPTRSGRSSSRPDGEELARGYSRETDATLHAEEEALLRVRPEDLVGAVLYSSLEPCGVRRTREVPCARLIVATAIRRVVFALREPPALAPGGGAGILRAAGVEVTELPALADEVRAVNAHLFG